MAAPAPAPAAAHAHAHAHAQAAFDHAIDIDNIVNMCGRTLCVHVDEKALAKMRDVASIRKGPFGDFPHVAIALDPTSSYTLNASPEAVGALTLTDWATLGLPSTRLPCRRVASPPRASINIDLEKRLIIDRVRLLIAETIEAATALQDALHVHFKGPVVKRVAVVAPLLDRCVLCRFTGQRCDDARRCAKCSSVLEWLMPPPHQETTATYPHV